MASVRVLADGRIKLALLTTKPANPALPTATELNAGIDLTFKVTLDNFSFGPTDSDKLSEKALGSNSNAQGLGAGNSACAFNLWRFWATAGGADATDDAAFAAVKVKGTTVWLYGRKTDKLATAAWAATDESYFGCETVTDTLQPVDGGFIKFRVPTEVQNYWTFIAVATGA